MTKVPEQIRTAGKRSVAAYLLVTNTLTAVIWNICLVLTGLLVIIVVIRVATRYLFGFVFLWSGELSGYLFVWISLLLLGVLVREESHLAVRLGYNKLSHRNRQRTRIGHLLFIIWFGTEFAYSGYIYAIEYGFFSRSSSMDFQLFWVYLILPIAGALLVLFAFTRIFEILNWASKSDHPTRYLSESVYRSKYSDD